MVSFSGLAIGLSLVFGCLLLALVAELYYLFWWKNRVNNREVREDDALIGNYAKGCFDFNFWRKPTSTQDRMRENQDSNCQEQQDLEMGTSKDLLIKAFTDQESVEAELMRIHNLAGPPRLLFTIKEETKEDLESDDGKSRKGSRTASLSDLILGAETPFLTPLASPHLKSSTSESYQHLGFNPLFESSTEAEFNRFKSSPPPKFKFLKDAEEKLFRKLMEEKEGSFLGFIISKNKEKDNVVNHLPQHPSSSSQVLPLSSSPTAFRPVDD